MKTSFTAFVLVCSLGLAAASTSGLRLVKDPDLALAPGATSFATYINALDLHQDGSAEETVDTLMNIFANCPEEVAELESCYADQAALMECVNCAWIDILSETSVDCDGLQAALEADAATCDSCLSECEEQQASLITCADSLYCQESDGDVEPPKLVVAPAFVAESDAGSLECRGKDEYCGTRYECCEGLDCKKYCREPRSGGGGCFSLESTVIVEGKGTKSIKDLVVGDMVVSDDKGTYTMYYSKGHYNEKETTKFLRIYHELNAKPLELTPGHMLFLASGELPVPAHSIKVGDVLKTARGPSKVTVVRKISRKGLANPLTLSGSIVIDGVVSSIHSEESGFEGSDAGWIYLSDIKISHWHTLMHFTHAPHRIMCGSFVTCTEKLTEDGLVPFHQYLYYLHDAAEQKQSVVLAVLILMLLVSQTAFFLVLELLMQYAVVIKFAVTCFVVGKWIASKSFEKKTKAKVV